MVVDGAKDVNTACGTLDVVSIDGSMIVGSYIKIVEGREDEVDCVHSHVELVSVQNMLQTLKSRMA